MTTLTVDTTTHSITTEAVVSPEGTVQFLGYEWYLPGAQPGWEVIIETLHVAPARKYYPYKPILEGATTHELEAIWHAKISQSIEPHHTPLAIAKRLYEGFLDSPYFDTFSEIKGNAFRLAPAPHLSLVTTPKA